MKSFEFSFTNPPDTNAATQQRSSSLTTTTTKKKKNKLLRACADEPKRSAVKEPPRAPDTHEREKTTSSHGKISTFDE